MREFGELVFSVEPRAERIVARTAYFVRLARALFFVQRSDVVWPNVVPIWEDPSLEYSLMSAVFRYGWRDFESAIDDKSLGLKGSRPLARPAIKRRVLSLVEGIEQQYADEKFAVPPDFDPMPPAEWRDTHPALLARGTLVEAELHALLQAITSYGLPRRPDGEVDWSRLKESANLGSVTTDAVRAAGEQLRQFLDDCEVDLDERAEVRVPETLAEIAPLGNLAVIAIRRARKNIKRLYRVHAFMAEVTAKKWEIARDAPKPSDAPDWWGPEEDRALITALGEYGVGALAIWIADPLLPFCRHIPADSLDTIGKLAVTERKRTGKAAKLPKELEEFTFINFPNRRLTRANTVIEFVEKKCKSTRHSKKHRSKGFGENEKHLELQSSKSLKILSLGELVWRSGYFTKFGPFPVGFTSVRCFPVRPDKEVPIAPYRCEIRDGGEHPLFVITSLVDEKLVVKDYSIGRVWAKLRERLGLSVEKKGPKAGMLLFGLLQAHVRKQLAEMEKGHTRPADPRMLRAQTVTFVVRVPVIPVELMKKGHKHDEKTDTDKKHTHKQHKHHEHEQRQPAMIEYAVHQPFSPDQERKTV
jgi:hypothetical protein